MEVLDLRPQTRNKEAELQELPEIELPPAPMYVKTKTLYTPPAWMFWRKKRNIEGRMTWEEWADRVKNSDFQIKPITEQNKLILSFAKRRTGKTADDAKDIIDSMARGEYNAANYDIVIPPWCDPKYFIRFSDISEVCFLPRIRIHIDEATRDFDCHDWASVPEAVRRWISEIGKYQQCVRVIVQVAKQIDPSFRDQCDEIYSLSRFWRFIHKRKWIRHINNPNVSPPWDVEGSLSNLFHLFKRWRFLTRKTFAIFNTYEHFIAKAGLSRKEQQALMIQRFNKTIEGSDVYSHKDADKLING
jgi:hypothetical protein